MFIGWIARDEVYTAEAHQKFTIWTKSIESSPLVDQSPGSSVHSQIGNGASAVVVKVASLYFDPESVQRGGPSIKVPVGPKNGSRQTAAQVCAIVGISDTNG